MLTFVAIVLFYIIGVHSMNNGVGRLPIMGWTTWCTDTGVVPCYDDYCDEKEVKSVADSIVKNGLDKLGYKWLLLDDCWASTTRSAASNEIQADATRFPSGTLKPLADYVHSLGLYLGAYTDVGPKTCRASRTGSWPFYQQDAQTFAAWTLDMVKMDWCDHPAPFTQQQLCIY